MWEHKRCGVSRSRPCVAAARLLLPHLETAKQLANQATALEVIRGALEEAGATMADVTRTVAFITSIDYVDAVARAHKEAFDAIRPAATCVVVTSLVVPHLLVEIQVDAVVEN